MREIEILVLKLWPFFCRVSVHWCFSSLFQIPVPEQRRFWNHWESAHTESSRHPTLRLIGSAPMGHLRVKWVMRMCYTNYSRIPTSWVRLGYRQKRRLPVGRAWPSAKPFCRICDEQATNQNFGWTDLRTVVMCGWALACWLIRRMAGPAHGMWRP